VLALSRPHFRHGEVIVWATKENAAVTMLRTAVLAPPAPFSGSATFYRFAKAANRWTGNLAIDFPGRARVPLVGSRFEATLVHAKRDEKAAG
jgi:hypothetical protein